MRVRRVDTANKAHRIVGVVATTCLRRPTYVPPGRTDFLPPKSREKESFLHKTVDSHSVQDQLIATPQGCISTEYAKRVAIPHPLYATYLDTIIQTSLPRAFRNFTKTFGWITFKQAVLNLCKVSSFVDPSTAFRATTCVSGCLPCRLRSLRVAHHLIAIPFLNVESE